MHIMDIIVAIAAIILAIIHIMNNHLVIVNDRYDTYHNSNYNNALLLWLRNQLKLNAKCELEDHIVSMLPFKRFQYFWYQMKAVIMMFVMLQFTIIKIELMKLYRRIELTYNTICNNIIEIILLKYIQQSNKTNEKAMITVQYDIDAVSDVFDLVLLFGGFFF